MKKILFILMLTGVLSCTKSPLQENGPRICPGEDYVDDFNIHVLEYSLEEGGLVEKSYNGEDEVDFSNGGIRISSDFGSEVLWELFLYDNSGNIIKKKKGKGSSLEYDWFGASDLTYVVSEGTYKIGLNVICRKQVLKNVKVGKKPSFKRLSPSYGALLRDFDGNGIFSINPAHTTIRNSHGWSGVNGDAAFDTTFGGYLSDSPSPMGGRYLTLYTKSSNNVGLWYHYGHSFIVFNVLPQKLSTNDPSRLYFNIFIRGDYFNNTNYQVGFQNTIPSTTNFLDSKKVNWDGWKLISVKLSDLTSSSGNKINSLNEMVNFVLQLSSAEEPTASELRIDYDFIIITVDEPFVNK